MENRIPKAMHPTTGELRAFLDGEVAPDRSSVIRDHLAGCSRCRTLGRHLREDESVVRDALTKMTGEPDLARARRELRRRLTSADVEPRGAGDLPVGGRTDPGGGADPARPTTREARAAPGWSEHLRTAALLLLLLGGITAALPGSPVRAWLLDVWGGDGNAPSAPVAEDEATEAPAPPGPEPREEATVRVDPSEGTVRIDLIGVEDGT
ncbi:MAG: anti-sigma factor family protein, partial [Longimicrobiales bacterium]